MKTLTVIAAAGLKVPREGAARKYIEQSPVSVPLTPYYRRRLRSGELQAVSQPGQAAQDETQAQAAAPTASATDPAPVTGADKTKKGA